MVIVIQCCCKTFLPYCPLFSMKYLSRLLPFCSFEQYMIEQGALTINGIEDIASTTIQKCWRGHRVRKGFLVRKDLFVKHERVKKVRKRASVAGQRKTPDLCANQSSRGVSPRYFFLIICL